MDANKSISDGLSIVELCENAKPPAKESFKVYRQGGGKLFYFDYCYEVCYFYLSEKNIIKLN